LLRLSQMEGGGTRVEKALRAGSQEPHVEPTCTSEDSSNSGAGSTEARRVRHSVGAMPLYGAATCTELREELRRRGLRVSGVKAALISRLQEADAVQKPSPTPFGEARSSGEHCAAPGSAGRAAGTPSQPQPRQRRSATAAATGAPGSPNLSPQPPQPPRPAGQPNGGQSCRRRRLLCGLALAAALLLLPLLIQALGRGRLGRRAARPGCASAMDERVWQEELLPRGSQLAVEWLELLPLLTAQTGQDASKAATLLLAAQSHRSATAAAGAVLRAFPVCRQKCALLLQGLDYRTGQPEAAGRMQAALVAFLQRCPQGLVVMDGLDLVDLRAMPVLFAALSEQGQFAHNGVTVLASRALFVFTAVLAGVDRLETEGDLYGVERAVKGALVEHFMAAPTRAGVGCGAEGAEVGGLALECISRQKTLMALRRRFDMAATVRS